jgi:hypothetical protein
MFRYYIEIYQNLPKVCVDKFSQKMIAFVLPNINPLIIFIVFYIMNPVTFLEK